MSQRPIARSPDLARLRSDGFDISVVAGHLVVRDVPYVNQNREVARGILISPLTLSGDTTATPGTHVASWVGSTPCTSGGVPIKGLQGGSPVSRLSEELAPTMSFSNKPPGGY